MTVALLNHGTTMVPLCNIPVVPLCSSPSVRQLWKPGTLSFTHDVVKHNKTNTGHSVVDRSSHAITEEVYKLTCTSGYHFSNGYNMNKNAVCGRLIWWASEISVSRAVNDWVTATLWLWQKQKHEWIKLKNWILRSTALFWSVNQISCVTLPWNPHTVGQEIHMTVTDW